MIRSCPSRNHTGLNFFNSVFIVDMYKSQRPCGHTQAIVLFTGMARTEAVDRAEACQTHCHVGGFCNL